MTRQYCHIGSRTIAYLDSAPGNTALRAYVLLHAFPLGAGMWEPQMRAIPTGWRLITLDLRGFGGSTTEVRIRSRAVGMEDYAADVVDLLEELSITRAVIGGLSMGGYAAFAAPAQRARNWSRRSCWPTRAPAPIHPRAAPTAATCWPWSTAKARRAWRAR